MRRRDRGAGMHFLAFCIVMFLVEGCSFFKDECDDSRKKIDALASVYSGVDPEQTYTECKNALAKCPNIVSGYKLMGTIDMANKNYESAIANYSRAFELNPKDPETENSIRGLSIYSVAFTGNKIEITDKKKITKKPSRMADITLKEYSQLDTEVRLLWLRSSLDEISKKSAEEIKKNNTNAEFTGTMATYASEIDQRILSEAEANSNGRFGDAFQKAFMDASMTHLTVEAVPK